MLVILGFFWSCFLLFTKIIYQAVSFRFVKKFERRKSWGFLFFIFSWILRCLGWSKERYGVDLFEQAIECRIVLFFLLVGFCLFSKTLRIFSSIKPKCYPCILEVRDKLPSKGRERHREWYILFERCCLSLNYQNLLHNCLKVDRLSWRSLLVMIKRKRSSRNGTLGLDIQLLRTFYEGFGCIWLEFDNIWTKELCQHSKAGRMRGK